MTQRAFVRLPCEIKGKVRERAGIAVDEINIVYAIEKRGDKGSPRNRVIVELKNKTSIMLGEEYATEDDFFADLEKLLSGDEPEATDGD